MIEITPHLAIPEEELSFTFIRASGPGGQNVNKVSTAVQLRFDARNSPSLAEEVRTRLERLAGARATREGEIVITAARFRSQERNRADAVERLAALIEKALHTPKKRKPTRPGAAAKAKLRQIKSHRSRLKSLRSGPIGAE
jgi:ribosome-associated protein